MNPKKSIARTIITRILVFPFFLGITFVHVFVLFIRLVINFIRYGGETITYTEKTNRKTIFDVYQKVAEIHLDQLRQAERQANNH